MTWRSAALAERENIPEEGALAKLLWRAGDFIEPVRALTRPIQTGTMP